LPAAGWVAVFCLDAGALAFFVAWGFLG